MNQAEIVKKNWADVSSEIQKNWSKLNHDDIEKTKGSVSAISTLVQQKHGVSSDQFDKKFADIVKRFDSDKDKMSQEGQAGQSVEPRHSNESRQPGQSGQGRDSGQSRDSKENRLNN